MKQILLAVIPNRVIFHFTTFENRVGKYFVKKGYRKSDLLLKLSDKHVKDIYNYTVEPNLSSNMLLRLPDPNKSIFGVLVQIIKNAKTSRLVLK